MSGRRRDEEDRAARFAWSDGDVIPLNADEVVQLPEGYDIGPWSPDWVYPEDEPQPDGSSYAPPEWTVRKPSLDQLAAMAEWIAQQDYSPHDGDDRTVASEISDEEFEQALGRLPEIGAKEQRAVLRGLELRRQGRDDAWADLLTCLRGGEATPHFLSVVADLIAANLLHNRGRLPSALSAAEAKHRQERYIDILRRTYRDKVETKLRERATDLITYELLCDADGPFDQEAYYKMRRYLTTKMNRGKKSDEGDEPSPKADAVVARRVLEARVLPDR